MGKQFVLLALISIFALLGCTSENSTEVSDSNTAVPDYLWVEFGPGGDISARAIMLTGDCPNIDLDRSSFPMEARTQSPPPNFENVQVCEYAIPSGITSAAVNGQSLSLPSSSPQKIVVVGDTGCRVKGTDIQNCTGNGEGPPWNFAEVAKAIENTTPDLIIHVGDFHYRETGTCDDRCVQSNIGYNWASWKADFFDPAKTILGQAPWIFIRGNHEDCERAWKGWYYFLDPNPLPSTPWEQANCQDYTDPYVIPFDLQNILVMDNSEIPDDYAATPDPTTVARYAEEFNMVETLAAGQTPVWLISHRPLWAIASFTNNSGQPAIAYTDLTLQQALEASDGKALPNPPIEMMLAGHIHLFEILEFPDNRPPQIVFGGGATELDPDITDTLINNNPAVLQELGITRQDITILHDISFGVIENLNKGWKVTVIAVKPDGNVETTFIVNNTNE